MNVQTRNIAATSIIPVERIREARAAFPQGRISYDAEFELPDFTALADLVSLFAGMNLDCDGLRYRSNGTLRVLLRDRVGTDARLAVPSAVPATGLKLIRWTTVLGMPEEQANSEPELLSRVATCPD